MKMRCEEFYEKWKKAGNFCEKHPRTASRIEKFLDQIVVELEEELAKSEIFQGENGPMGPVISERASRPLISETDPEVRYEAIHQIVKAAEEKHMDGRPAKVVGREVEEILNNIHTKKDLLRVAREIRNEDRMERQAEKEAKRDELAAAARDLALPELLDLRQGDFRIMLEDVPDNSIDLIFTDPPYDADSIPLYEDLAVVAARVLKPGGSLLAYCGQYALPEILTSMSRHLRYWWLAGIKHQNNFSSLAGKKVYVCWKPLVWFVKQTNGAEEFVMDMFDSKTPDKALHDWGQSGEEAAYFIEKLCPPDGTILDPFAGSGTTLHVAATMGIKSIGVEIDERSINLIRGRINGLST